MCVCVCVVAHRPHKGLGKVAFLNVLKINIISFPCVPLSPANLGSSAGLNKVISCQGSKGRAGSRPGHQWASVAGLSLPLSTAPGPGPASMPENSSWQTEALRPAPSALGLCFPPPLGPEEWKQTLPWQRGKITPTEILHVILMSRKVMKKSMKK